MRPAFSIIVPCFNEEKGLDQLEGKLGGVLGTLSGRGGCECLFVDDGSLDGTREGLEALARRLPDARVLRHPARRGVGAALRTGFEASEGEIVLTMDADCTYDPAGFLLLLRDLEASGADIATASPYHPRGSVVGVPAWRLFLSKTLSRAYGALLPVRLHTYTALFRAQRRRVVKEVHFWSNDFLGVAEFLIGAILAGFRAVETPMVLETRRFGVSKLRTLAVIRDHLGMIFRLAARKRRRGGLP